MPKMPPKDDWLERRYGKRDDCPVCGGEIDENYWNVNSQAREWKLAFLKMIGKGDDPWAVTTFTLADKDKYFQNLTRRLK